MLRVVGFSKVHVFAAGNVYIRGKIDGWSRLYVRAGGRIVVQKLGGFAKIHWAASGGIQFVDGVGGWGSCAEVPWNDQVFQTASVVVYDEQNANKKRQQQQLPQQPLQPQQPPMLVHPPAIIAPPIYANMLPIPPTTAAGPPAVPTAYQYTPSASNADNPNDLPPVYSEIKVDAN